MRDPGAADPRRPLTATISGTTEIGPSDPTLSSAVRSLLGFGAPTIPLEARLFVEVISTTGAVTVFMAFLVFGKRRRDGEQPAPDEVLQAAAARMRPVASSALALEGGLLSPRPAPGFGPGGGISAEELALPRWRRPSLLEARKADPLRSVTTQQSMSFDRGAVGPIEGHERRRLRYRLVRLLDQPDELRGSEIGFLDEGDEVQLLERYGAYWLVLCPDGSRGWIHKMTLGDVIEDEPVGLGSGRRSFGTGQPSSPALAGSGSGPAGFGPAGYDASAPGSPGADHEPAELDEDVVTAFFSARSSG